MLYTIKTMGATFNLDLVATWSYLAEQVATKSLKLMESQALVYISISTCNTV
jgi:hypothetical protein